MKPPSINVGTVQKEDAGINDPGRFVHISPFARLPFNTPWGNLLLKSAKIVQRLAYVNEKLERLYSFHGAARKRGFINPLMELETEEVIYWLRKSADEIIQVLYVGFIYQRDGTYPEKIEVDCIGALLSKKAPKEFVQLFDAEIQKLEWLNNASNAFKHSFLGSDINLMGDDEPVVFSLSVERNNRTNPVEFSAIPLSDFVQVLDRLYAFLKTKCGEFFPPNTIQRKATL